MSREMKAIVENDGKPLTDEERNLLSVAYKNVVGTRVGVIESIIISFTMTGTNCNRFAGVI
jgi:hypothetical protein